MKCEKVLRLLTESLDTGASEKDNIQIQDHLESCEDCRTEWESMAKSWDLLDNYPAPKVSNQFTADVMRKVRAEQTEQVDESTTDTVFSFPTYFSRHRLQLSALAACLVLAISIGVIINDPASSGISVSDDEIVRNLDLYENLELLENLEMLSDYDAVQEFEDQT